MGKLILLLDAGHGNNTAGKRTPDGSMREFQFNNPTAQYVGKFATEGYENVEVHYMHDLDGSEDVALKARTDKANAIYAKMAKGDQCIYVSIHANASGDSWSSANGIETFTYTTKPAKAVELATDIQNEVLEATGLANRGVKADNLHVLRETHMTAVLVECGFMSNKAEATLLKSDVYRQKVAKAILKGIVKFTGIKAKPAPAKPTPPPTTPNKPVTPPVEHDGQFYRVVAGSYKNKAEAQKQVDALKAKGIESFIVPFNK